MRDTYLDILRDSRNCYLTSGWTEERDYYTQHVQYIRNWCRKWSIQEFKGIKEMESKLIKTPTWTRETWN